MRRPPRKSTPPSEAASVATDPKRDDPVLDAAALAACRYHAGIRPWNKPVIPESARPTRLPPREAGLWRQVARHIRDAQTEVDLWMRYVVHWAQSSRRFGGLERTPYVTDLAERGPRLYELGRAEWRRELRRVWVTAAECIGNEARSILDSPSRGVTDMGKAVVLALYQPECPQAGPLVRYCLAVGLAAAADTPEPQRGRYREVAAVFLQDAAQEYWPTRDLWEEALAGHLPADFKRLAKQTLWPPHD